MITSTPTFSDKMLCASDQSGLGPVRCEVLFCLGTEFVESHDTSLTLPSVEIHAVQAILDVQSIIIEVVILRVLHHSLVRILAVGGFFHYAKQQHKLLLHVVPSSLLWFGTGHPPSAYAYVDVYCFGVIPIQLSDRLPGFYGGVVRN